MLIAIYVLVFYDFDRVEVSRELEQANQVLASYVPRFNAQFAVAPTQEGSAYRPLQETLQTEDLFCFKYPRIVAADNTISFATQRLQLLPDAQRRSYARARVQVHEHFDGHLSVHLAGRCVATTEAPLETPKVRMRSGPRGGKGVSMGSQTPSSAVLLLDQATTAELGESDACHVAQSSAPRRPASTHPWRKPLLKPKRTKSLDNNIVEYGNDLLEDNHSSSSNSFSNFISALLLKSSFSNKSGRLALVRLIDSFLRHRAISA
jgi:hypothetical protein